MAYFRDFIKKFERLLKHYIVWIIVCSGFVISLLFICTAKKELRYSDEKEYYTLSETIVTRHQYINGDGTPTAFRPPVYPLFLALLSIAGLGITGMKVFNALSLSLTIYLCYRFGSKFGVQSAGFFAAGLAAFYPLFHYTGSTLYPQTMGSLLFMTFLYCLVKANGKISFILTAGIVYGILILMIPGFLLLLGLVVPVIVLVVLRGKRGFIGVLVFLVTVTVVVIPWTVRNYNIFEKIIPVSTNSGINLLYGNSENTRPNSGTNVDIDHYIQGIENFDEAELDAHYRDSAFKWIQENPRDALVLYVLKALNYFNFSNELATKKEESLLKDIVSFLSYYAVLGIVLIRLFFIRYLPIRKEELVLYILYFGNAFLGAVYFTRIRFRVPFDWLLMPIAGNFIAFQVSQYKEKNGWFNRFSTVEQ